MLADAARELNALLRRQGRRIATAESCTGGLVAAALTQEPGASTSVEGGVVSYSYEAKTGLLDVPADLLQRDGAVSESVARDMATGALRRFPLASCALAITGIAGPDGGTPAKPVGTVCFAWAIGPVVGRGSRASGVGTDVLVRTGTERFRGDRAQIRLAAGRHALRMLEGLLEQDLADRPPSA